VPDAARVSTMCPGRWVLPWYGSRIPAREFLHRGGDFSALSSRQCHGSGKSSSWRPSGVQYSRFFTDTLAVLRVVGNLVVAFRQYGTSMT
jgi:hypothetical protein